MTLFTFPLLWINEVMPSNVTTVVENHGEYEPWIELYNGDTVTIDLSDYRLSNDYDDLGRWAFSDRDHDRCRFSTVYLGRRRDERDRRGISACEFPPQTV